MLARPARRIRAVVTAAVLALLLTGTLWGTDDAFPFGPFRMYAGKNDPNGVVNSTTLQAVLPGGTVVTVDERATGLRRAELEGEIDDFTAHPQLLSRLAAAHHALHPADPAYTAVRVVLSQTRLHDGALGATTEQVLAEWRRP